MGCCRSEVLDDKFGPKRAAADLRRYHRRGPFRTTQLMLRGLEPSLPVAATLLDIGGGVGVLHHELLDRGASRAWAVEPSGAFLRADAEETGRRGHTGRVEFINADVRQAADTLPVADVVTMDRVVCCDPDYESLLRIALAKAQRLFAFSYPRARWGIRGVTAVQNAVRRLRGSQFRVFVHSPDRMEALVQAAGFERVYQARSAVWCAGVYARTAAG
jgi:magnesium-protoporphyrin O-methyltransferase